MQDLKQDRINALNEISHNLEYAKTIAKQQLNKMEVKNEVI